VIYSIHQQASATANNAALIDVACSANARCRLLEIVLIESVSVTPARALNRPTAIGTRTTPVALIAEDPADPAQTVIDSAVAWSAAPTLATNDLIRFRERGAIGSGCYLRFPYGLLVNPSGSLVLVNRILATGNIPFTMLTVDL